MLKKLRENMKGRNFDLDQVPLQFVSYNASLPLHEFRFFHVVGRKDNMLFSMLSFLHGPCKFSKWMCLKWQKE